MRYAPQAPSTQRPIMQWPQTSISTSTHDHALMRSAMHAPLPQHHARPAAAAPCTPMRSAMHAPLPQRPCPCAKPRFHFHRRACEGANKSPLPRTATAAPAPARRLPPMCSPCAGRCRPAAAAPSSCRGAPASCRQSAPWEPAAPLHTTTPAQQSKRDRSHDTANDLSARQQPADVRRAQPTPHHRPRSPMPEPMGRGGGRLRLRRHRAAREGVPLASVCWRSARHVLGPPPALALGCASPCA